MADETRADKWRLIRGTDLKSEDRHVLLILFLIQGDNNAAFCRQETLAEEIGIHPRSVRRSLQRLNAAGIVQSAWQIRNGIPMRHYAIDFEQLRNVQRFDGRTPVSYPQTTDGRTSASYPETADGRTPVSAAVGHERPKPQDTSVLQERSIEHPLKIQSERTQKTKFQKPTAEQVQAYAAEQNQPSFDAGQFCDYYESNGWRVGRNPMKDWRATVRRWMKTGGTQNNGKASGNAGALKAWRLVLRAAKDNHGDGAGFEAAIGPELAAIVRALRLTRQKIDTANNYDRREQEREFIQAFIRQGAAA